MVPVERFDVGGASHIAPVPPDVCLEGRRVVRSERYAPSGGLMRAGRQMSNPMGATGVAGLICGGSAISGPKADMAAFIPPVWPWLYIASWSLMRAKNPKVLRSVIGVDLGPRLVSCRLDHRIQDRCHLIGLHQRAGRRSQREAGRSRRSDRHPGDAGPHRHRRSPVGWRAPAARFVKNLRTPLEDPETASDSDHPAAQQVQA